MKDEYKYKCLKCGSTILGNNLDGTNCPLCKGLIVPTNDITLKKYIKFEELEQYMLKPVYDNEQKRWKVLKGYAKVEDERKVMFTETDFMRCDSEWITYTDTLLSDHDKN